MEQGEPTTLVSTDWLAEHIKDPDLRILDGSWYLPLAKRNPKDEYDIGHIPSARFFDIDEISDQSSLFPHMAPSPEKFIARMQAMGIGDGHQVVVYDSAGLMSAARVWWLFRLMGKPNVAVLDGGLPKWRAEGHPIEDLRPVVNKRHFSARFQNQLVRNISQVEAASKIADSVIVDARSPGRFAGIDPEPRQDLQSGHIPNSVNVPFEHLLNSDGTMKDHAGLKDALHAGKVDLSKPVIATCGSGITACILALAFERLGKFDWSVYDGSWAEWGASEDVEKVTGEI
ncbi:MAG: 3-mercaptopyruvate sulfurtransferase [Aestuariivita sp.]|nr:3-mercaptopyruvate sulfurtransferase [Aestuariivita sp.]